MLTDIIIALLVGVIIGTISGITPGIHVNLVATTLLTLSPLLLEYTSALPLAVFIMSLAVTHSFLDTIPSTFLGAPESETALSILPAQKMLLNGEGYLAVKLTILGTYAGLITAILLVPLFIFTAKTIRPLLKPYLAYLLILIILFMILRQKEKIWSVSLFFLSGMLGLIVLNLPSLNEPLFPLLSGLFGVSGLLISYFENTKVPEQDFKKEIKIEKTDFAKIISASAIGVIFIQFFPGLGPAQGAVLSTQVFKKMKDWMYLTLTGAMGTMSVVFSLVTFYTLGNAKDGSIVVLSKLIKIDLYSFMILITAFLIAGSISLMLTLFLSKKFSQLITLVNYKALVFAIIVFIFIMAFVLGGALGVLVLITSSAIGLLAPLKNIPRSHAMGCLLLPVVMMLIL